MLMVEKRKRQSRCFSMQVSFSLHLLFFWICLMAQNLSTVFANGILSRPCLSPPPPLRLLLQWYALLFFFLLLLFLVNDWSDANSLLQFWIWILKDKKNERERMGLVLFADVGWRFDDASNRGGLGHAWRAFLATLFRRTRICFSILS